MEKVAAPESYNDAHEELSPLALKNLAVGKEKKSAADNKFKEGNIAEALALYHQSLLYFRGLNKNNPLTTNSENGEKPKNEIDEELEKVYSNMSACHTRLGRWQRVIETADKALAINKENNKALFRKARALGELKYFEKAEAIFEELLKKDASDAEAIKVELAKFRARENVRQKAENARIRGFLNKDKRLFSDTPDKSLFSDGNEKPVLEPLTSATIEEIVDAA